MSCRFRDGYVMVGFSLGYLVVISTHLDEIGREQFCARFHKDSLRDIAYCASKHKVATAGENQIKIVDMRDWQEIYSEEISDAKGHASGPLDKLVWTPDGAYVSVSSRNGCLYVYAVDSNAASSDAATRAAKARELEESQAIINKVLYKPFTWLSLLGCASVLTATTVVTLSNALGVPLTDMWKLAAYTWSV
jgi:WD40 repeat protein